MVESSLVCGLVKRSSTVGEELTREVERGERRGENCTVENLERWNKRGGRRRKRSRINFSFNIMKTDRFSPVGSRPIGHRLISAESPPRSHTEVSYITNKPSK